MLSSSFDSLISLNVYMSSPRHLTCLFFTLLLMMAICGAQGRVSKTRHTCITFIAKSKTRPKEKNKSYNHIKMCGLAVCRASLSPKPRFDSAKPPWARPSSTLAESEAPRARYRVPLCQEHPTRSSSPCMEQGRGCRGPWLAGDGSREECAGEGRARG